MSPGTQTRIPTSILSSHPAHAPHGAKACVPIDNPSKQMPRPQPNREADSWASERNVIVLLPRILELLVAKLAQPHRHPLPGRMRHDHLVDEAHARGHERVGEALFIFAGVLGDLRRGLAAEDD